MNELKEMGLTFQQYSDQMASGEIWSSMIYVTALAVVFVSLNHLSSSVDLTVATIREYLKDESNPSAFEKIQVDRHEALTSFGCFIFAIKGVVFFILAGQASDIAWSLLSPDALAAKELLEIMNSKSI